MSNEVSFESVDNPDQFEQFPIDEIYSGVPDPKVHWLRQAGSDVGRPRC